jgi:hypothetical protein
LAKRLAPPSALNPTPDYVDHQRQSRMKKTTVRTALTDAESFSWHHPNI